ncbi:phospholipase/carboxylesterase [Leptospira fainei serovar Hurstbridge str. BUT 6]|uniref:Phospholipase/carboxylesterase n=1 Tax=Leptospira fainei serovar Hurstbridge str. BUT 6 TaxID=1193011 RepID=S3VZU5_9LEPT|nr:phospholipase/carboxylesterase [Leptospira fainei]EPG73617.1 phospholipase/carboxylesterase [Leptospira fainei serovar Hurstbridge str. BUT 6]
MSLNIPLEQIGPLKAARIKGDPNGPYVIFFHGYGANAYDLLPLYSYMDVPIGTNFIFPDGILEIPLMPGYNGRAWFPIDMEALQRAMMAGGYRDFSDRYPQGLAEAREKAVQMIEALNVPMDRIVIGGFSQGSMLATDITLRAETKPKGLVILSGTLIDEPEWSRLAKKTPGYPFFQSHGRMDPVLGYPAAKKLETLLKEAGWEGELLAFPGGHEIPEVVLLAMNRYLKDLMQ